MSMSSDQNRVAVERLLDQSAPGWRKDFDLEDISSGIFFGGVFLLIVSILSTAISACLVHGARTRNVCLMMPWIVLTLLGLILEFGNIQKVLLSIIVGDVSSSGAIMNFVSNIFGWVLGFYTFLVVRSFQIQIQIEDEEGAGGDHEVHYKRGEREMQGDALQKA